MVCDKFNHFSSELPTNLKKFVISGKCIWIMANSFRNTSPVHPVSRKDYIYLNLDMLKIKIKLII